MIVEQAPAQRGYTPVLPLYDRHYDRYRNSPRALATIGSKINAS